MKKILLITILAALSAYALAAGPRGLWWELKLDTDDILKYVDSQDYNTSSTGWLVEAVCSGEPGYVQSTETHHNYLIKVIEAADAMPGMAWVYVDQQKWTEDWTIGDTVMVTLTWLPTGKSVSNSYIIRDLFEEIWLTDYVEPGTTWVLPAEMFVAEEPEEKPQD